MSGFRLQRTPLDGGALRQALQSHAAGGFCSFEGWVREQHQGRAVLRLDYEAYDALAQSEGDRILAEARARFAVVDVRCDHRVGTLELGDCAVWVGASAAHRDAAFAACRFVIDEVKQRVPIWKHERYLDGTAAWVQGCHAGGHAQG